jgi:hypothetical protein
MAKHVLEQKSSAEIFLKQLLQAAKCSQGCRTSGFYGIPSSYS